MQGSPGSKTAILITGGAGFIGSHLCERLLAAGERVVVMDNFNNYYDPRIKRLNLAKCILSRRFRLYEGDVRQFEFVKEVFSREKIDRVVHLAARAGVRPSIAEPLLYEEVNGMGTVGLLECAARAKVRNFLFGSSSSVYGDKAQAPFTEAASADHPISPYAATKRAAEIMAYTYHHLYGLPVTALRFFTVYGPRQRPDMAIHRFTRWIDEGSPITLFGNGDSRRDYTYVSDIIDALCAALEKPLGYEIINLGGAQTTRLIDLIRMLEAALGSKAMIRKTGVQPGDVPITWANISKAEQLLDWRPRVVIQEGIVKFVEWYLSEKKHALLGVS